MSSEAQKAARRRYNASEKGRASRARYAATAKEIAKCEVVCANCHRIRTVKERARG